MHTLHKKMSDRTGSPERAGQWLGLHLLLAAALLSGSCKKLVDVGDPSNELLTNVVFNNNSTMEAAIAGMYTNMSTASFSVNYYATAIPSLTADDMIYLSGSSYDQYRANLIPANDSRINTMWSDFYKTIYEANGIIEGAAAGTGLSAAKRKQAVGEAKFVRAYMHFYLVNLFGDVPLITTTDVTQTAMMPRTSKDTVYRQIIADLTDAQDSLADDYSYASGDRTRANKWAATALLARVYLYTGDYSKAAAAATAVIDNSSLYQLLPEADLGKVFLANSKEAIWQLYSYGNYGYTYEGSNFLPGYSSSPRYILDSGLVNSFEPGDARLTNWVNSTVYSGNTYYYPYKYKQYTSNSGSTVEYDMQLRLAEQYLIRAEARAAQNEVSGAQDDLNMIRNRAGLANTTAVDQASLLDAIAQERRVEFFSEMGHRWLDLKRTGKADSVFSVEKPDTWQSKAILYPIPQTAIDKNPNLKQNDGY